MVAPRRTALLVAALLIVALSVTDAQPAAQKRNPAAASAPSPAASSPPVGIAVEALNATGVASLLNASTVATIFAPDNAAFISLASQLNMTSRYQLFASPFATNVTLLHIIPGVALRSTDLPAGQTLNATSLLGPALQVTRNGNAVSVAVAGNPNSTAQVVKADIPFNAAVVHVINKVLLPPTATAAPTSSPSPSPSPVTSSPSPVIASPSPILLSPVPLMNETSAGGGGGGNFTGGAGGNFTGGAGGNTTNMTTGGM